jgi:hypothetical protein
MALVAILADDLFLGSLSLFFVFKRHFHETKATASHCGLVSHDDLVRDLPKLREIIVKVILYNKLNMDEGSINLTLGLELEATHEELNLVLLARSME